MEDRTQWCGSGVVIHWTPGEQDLESIATAAGYYASPYRSEMIAILKALEALSEKLTDSAIAVRIHSDSRQALKQLSEGPASQDERAGCKIWGGLVAVTERNTENVVNFIWVPGHAGVEGNEWQTRWRKREVSQRQTLTWDQRSSTCSSSLCSRGTAQSKPTGTANWHLRCYNGQLSSRIPPGVPRQAQRAIHQLRLNRLTSTASYQAFIGQITSPICRHCANGEVTAEHLLLVCPKWAAKR